MEPIVIELKNLLMRVRRLERVLTVDDTICDCIRSAQIRAEEQLERLRAYAFAN